VKSLNIQHFYTDYWHAYQNFLPKDRHTMTKAETYTVEGMNSQLRHYLARFHRKTKCYSKSPRMAILSIYLFMAKDILG
jgi:insertion element IS1 protein InsB